MAGLFQKDVVFVSSVTRETESLGKNLGDRNLESRHHAGSNEVLNSERTKVGVIATLQAEYSHLPRLGIDDPILGDAGFGILNSLVDQIAVTF